MDHAGRLPWIARKGSWHQWPLLSGPRVSMLIHKWLQPCKYSWELFRGPINMPYVVCLEEHKAGGQFWLWMKALTIRASPTSSFVMIFKFRTYTDSYCLIFSCLHADESRNCTWPDRITVRHRYHLELCHSGFDVLFKTHWTANTAIMYELSTRMKKSRIRIARVNSKEMFASGSERLAVISCQAMTFAMWGCPWMIPTMYTRSYFARTEWLLDLPKTWHQKEWTVSPRLPPSVAELLCHA